ncbi:hypothetical protein D3C78_893630 [compost metagenome]
MVAIQPRTGFQAAGIGTGLGLGEGECTDHRPAGQRCKVLLLLQLAAELEDGHAPYRIVHTHDGRAGAIASSDFFQGHGIGHVAGVTATILLGYQHAEQAEFGHLLDRFPGEAVFLVPLFGKRLEAFLGKSPDRIDDLLLLVSYQHGSPQYRHSTAMAVASPPPMQMAATPRRRLFWRRADSRVTRIRAPDAPIGCPRAQAPP